MPARAADPGTISTMAGGPGAGPAPLVAQTPRAIQSAGGSVYVLDVDPSVPPIGKFNSAVIRRIDVASGQETVVAGDGRIPGGYGGDGGDARQARFADPQDLAVDGAGNVYVADFGSNRIRRIGTNGIVTTIAGGDTHGFAGDGGPASQALVDGPYGVATDTAGRVYFADLYNFRVRRIDTDGTITTVAGNGTAGSGGDGGPAVNAQLIDVRGLEVDAAGTLYLPDLSAGRIRRVTGGVITTMAAFGAFSVTLGDTPGSIFAAYGYSVRKVLADGTTTTVTGADTPGFVEGAAGGARFGQIRSVSSAGGSLYIGDYGNRRVRVLAGGSVSSLAGNGTSHDAGDGRPAIDAQLNRPTAVTPMPDGGVVFIDEGNNRLRRVKGDGTVVAFAGTGQKGFAGDGGPATAALLDGPFSVATAPDGSVLLADGQNRRIRRVAPDGTISTVAGNGVDGSSPDGTPAASAAIRPGHLAVDSNGTLYFGEGAGNVRFIAADGTLATLIKASISPEGISDLAVLGDGLYYISQFGLRRRDQCGTISTVAPFATARGLAADPAGNLFVTETGYRGDNIRYERVTRVGQDGTATVIAGAGPPELSGDGGLATAANFDGPWDVAVLPSGDLAVADANNDRIRRIHGVVATAGGSNRPCWTPPPPPPAPTDPPAPPPAPAPVLNPAPVPPPRSGYWMVAGDGSVYAFGDARYHGSAPPGAVDLEPAPDGNGYWAVDGAGAVWARGSARHAGSASGSLVRGETVTSLSATPSGNGYWLFTSAGRALPFGDAPFLGDMRGTRLNGPVLDSVPTPSGRGYYMVASDGGIFAFGDATFRGSMGGRRLNAPVQSLVPAVGGGYWLVASDGGVFAFDALFRGSMGGNRLNRPVTGMVPFGNGYLMVGEDGGIFNFSDRPFHGSLGASPPPVPVVAVAALAS